MWRMKSGQWKQLVIVALTNSEREFLPQPLFEFSSELAN